VSENDISKPFFSKQKQAITQTTYLKDCTKARLMPFMDLNENEIQLVPIKFNPQNCPQSRPIETLWTIIDDMVYDKGWEARNIDQLKKRITTKLKETDIKLVQTMFLGIRKQLREIADKRPYEACSI
jgi:hypothetical protein